MQVPSIDLFRERINRKLSQDCDNAAETAEIWELDHLFRATLKREGSGGRDLKEGQTPHFYWRVQNIVSFHIYSVLADRCGVLKYRYI